MGGCKMSDMNDNSDMNDTLTGRPLYTPKTNVCPFLSPCKGQRNTPIQNMKMPLFTKDDRICAKMTSGAPVAHDIRTMGALS